MRPVILGFGQKGNNAVRARQSRTLPAKMTRASLRQIETVRAAKLHGVILTRRLIVSQISSRVDTPAACPPPGMVNVSIFRALAAVSYHRDDAPRTRPCHSAKAPVRDAGAPPPRPDR